MLPMLPRKYISLTEHFWQNPLKKHWSPRNYKSALISETPPFWSFVAKSLSQKDCLALSACQQDSILNSYCRSSKNPFLLKDSETCIKTIPVKGAFILQTSINTYSQKINSRTIKLIEIAVDICVNINISLYKSSAFVKWKTFQGNNIKNKYYILQL